MSRVLMAAGLAVFVGVTSVAMLSAQSKTDEDYDKLMKGVGAARGAMAKAASPADAATEAAKLVALFKDAQQFWTARGNKEAAEWSGAAMMHASEIEKAGKAEPAAIKAALWDIKIKGLNGDIVFKKSGPEGKESGQSQPNVYLIEITDGKIGMKNL